MIADLSGHPPKLDTKRDPAVQSSPTQSEAAAASSESSCSPAAKKKPMKPPRRKFGHKERIAQIWDGIVGSTR
jgi:hypothetical protein